ncbi:MAG: hypothetical protein HYS13_01755 [Planctomycetia bacterium]|nr:hypothetical protein [Planctomycetia bacterium]
MQSNVGIWFWFVALAGGLVLLVLSPVCLIRRRGSAALRRAWLAAVCGLASASAADLLSPADIAWEQALFVAACIAAAYLVLETATAAAQRRRTAVVSLTGAALLLSLATVQALRSFFRRIEPSFALLQTNNWQWLPVPGGGRENGIRVVLTDSGRPIQLFVPRPPSGNERFDESGVNHYLERLIRVSRPDVRSNCFGWVFTGGEYLIRGRDVPAILSDNGYGKVADPQADDLAVYLDDEGQIVHVGVVKALGPEFVLVESKFGPLGRYLHTPMDQCFGSRCAYYRSRRRGHHLAGLSSPAQPGPMEFRARGN